jgi:hypothetical protein
MMTQRAGFHLIIAFVTVALTVSAHAQDSSFMAARRSAPPPTSISTEGIALNNVTPSYAETTGSGDSQVRMRSQDDLKPGPSASDQPEMATGLDLKGPPERFFAGETPE